MPSPKTLIATTTRAQHENIGNDLLALMRGVVNSQDTGPAAERIGLEVAAMIHAAVKAAIPGRQSNKQVKEVQQAARQAFARALARKAKKLRQD